jgi:hypothetical protein
MKEAIFLSASIPDIYRAPEYAASADTVAISSAVNALLFVTLGRRPLVWGGHPAITPMVWEACRSLDVAYSEWVVLYQSEFFEDSFPEDNRKFGNVRFVPAQPDRESSLCQMRLSMFQENTFKAAVFLGGMKGILDEFDLFVVEQRDANVFPILSTGGATLDLGERIDLREYKRDLLIDRDYVSLFHRLLNISPGENRYGSPGEQPDSIDARS